METYLQIHWKNFSFSQTFTDFQNGASIERPPSLPEPADFRRVSSYFTPLSITFIKVCGGVFAPYFCGGGEYLTHVFDFFSRIFYIQS